MGMMFELSLSSKVTGKWRLIIGSIGQSWEGSIAEQGIKRQHAYARKQRAPQCSAPGFSFTLPARIVRLVSEPEMTGIMQALAARSWPPTVSRLGWKMPFDGLLAGHGCC